MNLLVISTNFPLIKGIAEYNLLKIQLKAVKSSFTKIFLLPTGRFEPQLDYSDSAYTIFLKFRGFKVFTLIFFVIYFFKYVNYLYDEIKNINERKTLGQLWASILAYLKGVYLLIFLKQSLKTNRIDPSELLIYSFWFDDYLLGALFLKKQFPNCKIIAGAHGHDLYPERHRQKRIPFRKKTIELIDHVIPDSEEGSVFLKSNYPEYSFKISTLNSGIEQKSIKTKPSNDGVFRILTLSRTHPVKRIEYLLKSLKKLENSTEFEIHYFHIGSGDELVDLNKLRDQLNFKKFKINFKGRIDDNELKIFIEERPIDVFLNVSASEGTSMSLIEALSYAIPVVVTKVGGNKKIGEYCKTLLPVNFTPKELFWYFERIYSNTTYREKLKNLSYKYWEEFHDVKIISSEIKKIFKKTAYIH